jgi:Secretory lipase/Secretion system C-terminal sorting domain
MKKLIILLLVVVFASMTNAQNLITAQLKGTKTKAQIGQIYNIPFLKFGAKYYKVTYESPDAKGQKDTLSGMLMVPDVVNFEFPILFYQHGTSDCKTCVPSRYTGNGGEADLGLLFASLGYVSLLPDYVGMGDGRGFQTYVHEATTVSASLDMLSAVKSWMNTNNIKHNGQHFLTGYSQGGYASMAIHKAMENMPNIEVTAASHMSGPYSLSRVMRDLVLQDKEYNFPGYLPNTILGQNEVDGTIYSDLSQVFKAPYIADIDKYHKGTLTLSALNSKLITLLKANNDNKSIAGRMLLDNVKQDILSNPNHPINIALHKNDLFRWAPKAPTKILYCKADDQVPYLNSVMANDTMKALGAAKLETIDVASAANHGACVTPALTQTVLFFSSFQRLLSDTEQLAVDDIQLFPNPTSQECQINGLSGGETIEIYDAISELKSRIKHDNGSTLSIDVSTFAPDFYFCKIISKDGKIVVAKSFIKM